MNNNISIRNMFVRYRPSLPDVFRDLNCDIDLSGMVYLAGKGKSGKSTLLRCISGVIPSVMGEISGRVNVLGKDSVRTPLDLLSNTVRYIGPNPYSSIFGLTVKQEIGLLASNEKESRSALSLMGIDRLWDRETDNLSGGEMVRLVLAGALVSRSKVLLLDSPMQELDPQGRQEFLDALHTLRGGTNGNLIVADPFWHELEDAVSSVLVVEDSNNLSTGLKSSEFFKDSWLIKCNLLREIPTFKSISIGDVVASMEDVHVSLGENHILKGFDFSIREGELVVVAGRNGSGKTTAMLTLAKAIKNQEGEVWSKGKVSYVFQHPQLQTVASTIKEELELEPKILKWDENEVGDFVSRIVDWLGINPEICPLDLHPADKRLLMIGASSHGSLLILDEPTIDLDTEDTLKVFTLIQNLRERGVAVVVITHDHDLMGLANRVVIVEDGRVLNEYAPSSIEFVDSTVCIQE